VLKPALAFMVLLLALTVIPTPVAGAEAPAGLALDYHLSFTEDDHPTVEVRVSGAPTGSTTLTFTTGSYLGCLSGSLSSVFVVSGAVTPEDKSLAWSWRGNSVKVANGSAPEFVLTYQPDMSRLGQPSGDMWQAFAVFRRKVVFFVAEDVFPMPETEPARVTVCFTLPGRTKVFSNLEEENGVLVARTDLFGNLRYDFAKAYFTGGEPFFSVSHETAWGDKYVYVWFDRDVADQMWLPSWGTTQWEEAERYMELAEQFAGYFREKIGPLPPRTVVFTNTKNAAGLNVGFNVDCYHWMQIWPRDSVGDLAHHVLHAYDFWPSQSKMWFTPDSSQPSGYLREGLNTYYEQVVPAEVLGDDKYLGKLSVFLALDQRGSRFGIQANEMHRTYNVSGLKVYLLDQYIRQVTGGESNVDDFMRTIWDSVKDNTRPHTLSAQEIDAAFAEVVGQANAGYLNALVGQATFDREAFASLAPSFQAYVDWISDEYFWGNPAVLCAFWDIAAAKGQEWPHYVNSPHTLTRYRQTALQPFKEHLAGLGKQEFTQQDIIGALNHVTGKDHAGFFEFWTDFGLPLAPADFAPLAAWDPNAHSEGQLVNTWSQIGTLWTEHYLSGIRQKAEIVLDEAVQQPTIGVQVSLRSFTAFPPEAEARAAISGKDVSFRSSYQVLDRGIYYRQATFQVTTSDPERRTFSFDLTLPSFDSHPSFGVFKPEGTDNTWMGEIYSFHPVPPVRFPLSVRGGEIILPDTLLSGESFTVHLGDQATQAGPAETVVVRGQAGQPVSVELFDRYGFLRGVEYTTGTTATTVGLAALIVLLAGAGVLIAGRLKKARARAKATGS